MLSHFVAVMNDVTARREAEAAEHQTYLQLQQLLEHSPAVIYRFTFEGGRVTPAGRAPPSSAAPARRSSSRKG